jgi:hypothetical protein
MGSALFVVSSGIFSWIGVVRGLPLARPNHEA